MKGRYFSLEKSNKTATLNIYGDITSFPMSDSEVSSANLSKQLESLKDVKQINVYINSYGGEVGEGLAIYNALKRHKAKIKTVCDGFACSIASVIFMAGDERIMNDASLLMIHNAWSFAEGNAEQLRKQADDLDKITQASIKVYKANSDLTEDEIKSLMNAETWILPDEAVEYGFATSVTKTDKKSANQNVMKQLFDIIKAHQVAEEEETEEEETEETDTDEAVEEEETEDITEDETEEEETVEELEDETDDEETDENPDTSNDDDSENLDEEETEEDTEVDDSEEETVDDSEEEEETEEDEVATEKWCGFFNALKKI